MRVDVEGLNSGFGIWLHVGDVWYGAGWNCRGRIRKRVLLKAKRIYQYERFGAPWID